MDRSRDVWPFDWTPPAPCVDASTRAQLDAIMRAWAVSAAQAAELFVEIGRAFAAFTAPPPVE